MYVTHLTCSRCGSSYSHEKIQTVCTRCGSTLLVCYDFESLKDSISTSQLRGRGGTLWRYYEVLPVEKKNIITLGEGYTPIFRLKDKNNHFLWLKEESLNPTGTFKARGMAVAISRAKELGITDVVVPSAGNAGAALSAYCARAGMRAHVFMPRETPPVIKRECYASGAQIHLVEGTIAHAGHRATEEGKKHSWFNMATLQEPYRLEGKKTMGYEIAEFYDWELPDVILYPTGGGTGLIGMWKAFTELEHLGWISEKKPRMITVQSTGCAPIVNAFNRGEPRVTPWKDPQTIAAGLRVPSPFADALILQVLSESGGSAVSVTDEEIRTAIGELATGEGVYACPEGAATFAAYHNLLLSGDIDRDETTLIINTGSGLLYPY
jgi:threonine synthase